MNHVIALCSQKGGVGKTTVSLNLAVALVERGLRVLLCDLDPQGGIGLSLARGEGAMGGLAEWMAGQSSVDEALLPTKLAGLTLLPRGRLDPLEAMVFERGLYQGGRFKALLEALRPRFDFILLDTPAGVGMATRVALLCADWALVPVQAEPLALRSVQQLLRVMDHVRSKDNPRLQLLGLLLTMVEFQQGSSRAVAEALWSGFTRVLDTVVPRQPIFGEASERGLPLALLGGPLSPEARRFDLLATEIEGIVSMEEPDEAPQARPERQLL